MANWLEITNTIINIETMNRVGDLSRAQQQVADQMLGVELRKQRDNVLISNLVDIVVKVREFIQDKQFLDAFLSAGVGLIAYKQIYPQIVDADIKLKVSDIKIKFLETIHSTISNDSINSILQTMLTQYLLTLYSNFQQTIDQLKQSNHQLVRLDPELEPDEEWEIDIGEELICLKDLQQHSDRGLNFRRGQVYKVFHVNSEGNQRGFVICDDFGNNYLFTFGKSGTSGRFAYFNPYLPSLEKDLVGWELCDKLFSDEFLNENLKSVWNKMLNIYFQSWGYAKLTRDQFIQIISQYRHIRQDIINKALKDSNIQATLESEKSNGCHIVWGIIGLLMLISFLVRNC